MKVNPSFLGTDLHSVKLTLRHLTGVAGPEKESACALQPEASVYNLFGQYLVQNAVEGGSDDKSELESLTGDTELRKVTHLEDHPQTWIRGEKNHGDVSKSPKDQVGVVPLPNGLSLHGLQMGGPIRSPLTIP